MAIVADDLEDANEHLLALALIHTMRNPGAGVTFPEMAVHLIETIRREGWLPAEERDQAEQNLRHAEGELQSLSEAHKEQEDELIKLRKQVAVLVAQLSGMATTTTTTPAIMPYPSTPWVTYTTSTTNTALPAAEVAAEILRAKRRLGRAS